MDHTRGTKTITIVPYAPEITDVKVLSTAVEGCEVETVLLVVYEGNDLDPRFGIQTQIRGQVRGQMESMIA